MSPILLLDKPSGIATHSHEKQLPLADQGFCEAISRLVGQELKIVQRLDRGTSGAILFARSAEIAAELSDCFRRGGAKKQYLFISDGNSEHGNEFLIDSPVGKPPQEAATDFKLMKAEAGYSLWLARPQTGRTHQIRIHAKKAGIPIVGDDLHGGMPYPRLMLHSQKLELRLTANVISHETEIPLAFSHLALLKRRYLPQWLMALDRSLRWMRSRELALNASGRELTTNCFRLIHAPETPLHMDRLAEVDWLHWFGQGEINDSDQSEINELLTLLGSRHWLLQFRQDRGGAKKAKAPLLSPEPPPLRWVAQENGHKYLLRRDCGMSSGLFLDQRANRLKVQAQARGKDVLNLFAYTSGFSVSAAAGGANANVAVDISSRFLQWSKENFSINNLDLMKAQFLCRDSLSYLATAIKQGKKFDMVICDPPSFARLEKGVFRLEKDLPHLANQVLRVLKPQGCAFFSCNYEGFSQADFARILKQAAQELNLLLHSSDGLPSEWDFEPPGAARGLKTMMLCLE